ncbi:hypothetical protein TBLA_0E02850 [Henningerozyma blattae CBS 6284]|uniref:Man1/Src1 C-terminal domain-containing protein n=1 Tax=Henningerozyma blattae (strain ATCC 34711 / CBS 6284 / DSM 70876 / NBRC 10599 / NRRL Y-10934 / UCD 77-7) TaxID=1071380 RepID=I2H4N9_HENB6|nr:hypothetical protein TBLA_0E02850 [Tetrapisispora blattae CBS 6284]CCH61341.1 hypothetical protein TBLA_0E02850 [Tetrapisispora blattae CBS 6284]
MYTKHLEPGFNTKLLKLAQLKQILRENGVKYPEKAKKSQLMKLYETEITPKLPKLRTEHQNRKKKEADLKNQQQLKHDNNKSFPQTPKHSTDKSFYNLITASKYTMLGDNPVRTNRSPSPSRDNLGLNTPLDTKNSSTIRHAHNINSNALGDPKPKVRSLREIRKAANKGTKSYKDCNKKKRDESVLEEDDLDLKLSANSSNSDTFNRPPLKKLKTENTKSTKYTSQVSIEAELGTAALDLNRNIEVSFSKNSNYIVPEEKGETNFSLSDTQFSKESSPSVRISLNSSLSNEISLKPNKNLIKTKDNTNNNFKHLSPDLQSILDTSTNRGSIDYMTECTPKNNSPENVDLFNEIINSAHSIAEDTYETDKENFNKNSKKQLSMKLLDTYIANSKNAIFLKKTNFLYQLLKGKFCKIISYHFTANIKTYSESLINHMRKIIITLIYFISKTFIFIIECIYLLFFLALYGIYKLGFILYLAVLSLMSIIHNYYRIHKKKLRCFFINTAKVSSILLPILFLIWYREQKLATGYCGYSLSPPSIIHSKSNVFSQMIFKFDAWLKQKFSPSCVSCPKNALYTFNMNANCQSGFEFTYSFFNFYGLIPMRRHCEKMKLDTKKLNKILTNIMAILTKKNTEAIYFLNSNYVTFSKDDLYEFLLGRYFNDGKEVDIYFETVVKSLKNNPDIVWKEVEDLSGSKYDKHNNVTISAVEEVFYSTKTNFPGFNYLFKNKLAPFLLMLILSPLLYIIITIFLITLVSYKTYLTRKKVQHIVQRVVIDLKSAKRSDNSLDYRNTTQIKELIFEEEKDMKTLRNLWKLIRLELSNYLEVTNYIKEQDGEIIECWEWDSNERY